MTIKDMEKNTVTFRIPVQKRTELDRIASDTLRDRSFVLNEAVDAYLEIRRWQAAHIEEGLKDAKTKRFVSAREIERAYRGACRRHQRTNRAADVTDSRIPNRATRGADSRPYTQRPSLAGYF